MKKGILMVILVLLYAQQSSAQNAKNTKTGVKKTAKQTGSKSKAAAPTVLKDTTHYPAKLKLVLPPVTDSTYPRKRR